MDFALNWDALFGGYVISVKQLDSRGFWRWYNLRKFETQGDALAFREFDCPHLTELQIKGLIKQYNPQIRYRRINSKRFTKV